MVDDDAIVLETISGALKKLGLEPLLASNGLEGLKQLEQSSPEMVILDVNMPELDGLQTCRLIRANRKYRDLPILMLTSRGEIPDMLQARKMGADDYLTKPVDPDALMKRVQRLLG